MMLDIIKESQVKSVGDSLNPPSVLFKDTSAGGICPVEGLISAPGHLTSQLILNPMIPVLLGSSSDAVFK